MIVTFVVLSDTTASDTDPCRIRSNRPLWRLPITIWSYPPSRAVRTIASAMSPKGSCSVGVTMAENVEQATRPQLAELVQLLVERVRTKARTVEPGSIEWTPPARPFFEPTALLVRPRTDLGAHRQRLWSTAWTRSSRRFGPPDHVQEEVVQSPGRRVAPLP
jgi:hypothetical protein